MQHNPAAEKVCFQTGHDFQAFPEGKPTGDPVTKTLFQPQVTRCRLCGMTPEHVFRYQLNLKGKAKSHGSGSASAPATDRSED